jgi:hypothetical protein
VPVVTPGVLCAFVNVVVSRDIEDIKDIKANGVIGPNTTSAHFVNVRMWRAFAQKGGQRASTCWAAKTTRQQIEKSCT